MFITLLKYVSQNKSIVIVAFTPRDICINALYLSFLMRRAFIIIPIDGLAYNIPGEYIET